MKAKPLILWGGVDINPSYYHEKPNSRTQSPNNSRDKQEFALVHNHIKDGIPIIGVCRGAQLLCVANGGSLYQHSEGHNRGHHVYCKDTPDGMPHLIQDVAAGHHQVMNLGSFKRDQAVIYGFAKFPTKVWLSEDETTELSATPEIVWFPETKCLAVQPHPEWMTNNHPFNVWLQKLLVSLIGEKVNVTDYRM